MTHFLIGLIAFVAIFGASLVGTLSALVIGLMISTASSSFSTRSNEVTAIAIDLIRINRMMQLERDVGTRTGALPTEVYGWPTWIVSSAP